MSHPTTARPRCALLLTGLALTCPHGALAAEPDRAPLTWETVPDALEQAEAEGFSGAVLLVRDGEVFLSEGYGLADREHNIPNTPDTIFALGSTPIDFTHVALLQLLDEGKLDLSDPISRFFDGFPEDKRDITLEHLRTGASGLPDFPAIPGVDADPDHGPLTRDELVERARKATLLFEPGTDRVHSHFAWGLLAAVVEVAGGEPYPDAITRRILKPAGMTSTGFYGQRFPGRTVARGYESKTWGEINSPAHWGETSWLVMGSGGMVGTTGDLFRFNRALKDGTLLSPNVHPLFPSDGVYANGNMYGFETYYNHGGDNLFYLNSNNVNLHNPVFDIQGLAQRLEELCEDRPAPNFSIGVVMRPGPDSVIVDRVLPGSPAEEAGLRPGDVLVAANDEPFDPERPLEALRPGIEKGRALRLRIERDGEAELLTIRPRPIMP
ncbi:MAG: serine hydrolase [Phycisphaerales bacterium JB059]